MIEILLLGFWIVLLFGIIEFILLIWVKIVRNDFQWLITKSMKNQF